METLLRPGKTLSIKQANNMAERWTSDKTFYCSYYQYLRARKFLRIFDGMLSEETRDSLCSVVEFYNFHR